MAAEQDTKDVNEQSDAGTASSSIVSDPTMMQIKVYSPYQTYFDDLGTSISAINDTGPFDILKGHHRFLTLLNPCELSIVAKNGEEKIKISHGVMYVKEDRVTVFLDV